MVRNRHTYAAVIIAKCPAPRDASFLEKAAEILLNMQRKAWHFIEAIRGSKSNKEKQQHDLIDSSRKRCLALTLHQGTNRNIENGTRCTLQEFKSQEGKKTFAWITPYQVGCDGCWKSYRLL